MIVNDFRRTIKSYYQNRSNLLNGEPRSLFDARVITIKNDSELITSDSPFYHRNIYGSMYEVPSDVFSNPNNWIWICPLSTKKCLIVARKGQFEDNPLLEKIMSTDTGEFCKFVNQELMYYSYRCTYSKNIDDEVYLSFKKMVPNPTDEPFRANMKAVMKLVKKYHLKTFE